MKHLQGYDKPVFERIEDKGYARYLYEDFDDMDREMRGLDVQEEWSDMEDDEMIMQRLDAAFI